MKKTFILFMVAFMAFATGLTFAAGQSEDRVEQEDRVGQEDAFEQEERVGQEDRDEQEERVGQEDRDGRHGLTGNLYRLSEIADFGIVSQADMQIGDVHEAILTTEGQITHLVVDLQDAEGVANGRYLVPLESIRIYDTENMTLDLQRSEEFVSYEESETHLLPEGSVRSSDFRGYDVIGPQDERIARMQDAVVDLETGEVVYVAITSGGFLGVGREYYAVPFDQIQLVLAEEHIWLEVTENDIDQMAGFDTDNWPAHGQEIVTGEIDRDGLTGTLYRTSEIEGFGIMSSADEKLGNVVEAVLSLDGQVTHLITSLYGVEGLEDGTYLVPMGVVSMYDSENISLDEQRIEEFAQFADSSSVWADDPLGTSSQAMSDDQALSDMENESGTSVDSEMGHTGQLPEGTIRSSDLRWYDVVGPGDDSIARIEDVVVDLETGEVVYVAIRSGGFLGIGRNYYAISFDQVQVEVAEERIRIDMTEADFAVLEGFDHDNWPNESLTQVSTY